MADCAGWSFSEMGCDSSATDSAHDHAILYRCVLWFELLPKKEGVSNLDLTLLMINSPPGRG
jgi:hypothetical protein